METKSWPLEVVLTATSGVTMCDFGDFQNFVAWLLGAPVFTASLCYLEPVIKQGLLEQHPGLSDFDSTHIDPTNWQEHLAFRRTYPLAQLAATVLNAQGGLSRMKAGANVSDSIAAEPIDFLPYYARYAPALELFSGSDPLKDVDPEALRELWRERETLPPIAFMSVPWDDVRRVIGEA